MTETDRNEINSCIEELDRITDDFRRISEETSNELEDLFNAWTGTKAGVLESRAEQIADEAARIERKLGETRDELNNY